VSGGIELLDAFHDVFSRNMRDLGTPVYGKRWFREVLTAFPDSRVYVVRHAGRPIAASLTHPSRSGVIEVPWASALRAFNPLCANVFLYWHMIRDAAEQQVAIFDFGRSTPGEGTYHFKKGWGAEPRELVWEYWTSGAALPDMSPKNPKFAMAIRLWRHLPLGVTRALGPRIVAHIP
jgi:FemAB-related protein (PEP-CTERM system-associated)